MTRIALYFIGLVVLSSATAWAEGKRIVVAGGDLTEIVFALGSGGDVVGVDQTSLFPQEATSLPQIGYVRRLAAEGILSLSPDLVLAADDAGPKIAFDQLQAANVTIARAPETPEPADIAKKIAFVGEAIGKKAAADDLATAFLADLASVKEKVARLPDRPKVLFILSVQGTAPLVGGRDTAAHVMIEAAGGENAASAFDGFKPMNKEAILAAQPDVILMMQQHAQRIGGIEKVMARPEISLTPAGQKNRHVTMDGLFLLGFGPRTADAIAELAAALQPEAAAAAGF
ncbi:MAG: ABC transporter substrate-binding protein [Pseudomonadota bacterium]